MFKCAWLPDFNSHLWKAPIWGLLPYNLANQHHFKGTCKRNRKLACSVCDATGAITNVTNTFCFLWSLKQKFCTCVQFYSLYSMINCCEKVTKTEQHASHCHDCSTRQWGANPSWGRGESFWGWQDYCTAHGQLQPFNTRRRMGNFLSGVFLETPTFGGSLKWAPFFFVLQAGES